MPVEKTGGGGFTLGSGSSTTADPIPSPSGLVDGALRLYTGAYPANITNVSFNQPWTIELLQTVAGSCRILTASRIYTSGQNVSLSHDWTTSAPGMAAAGMWLTGYDPDKPFTQMTATGANGTATITGPPLTPTRDGSIVAYLWAAHYTSSATSRALTPPTSDGFVSWLTSGNIGRNTASRSNGINIAYAFRYANAGETVQQNITAPSMSSLAGTMAFGTVIQPAAGQVVTGSFLPFFGR